MSANSERDAPTLWARIKAKLPKTLTQQENELFDRFDACLAALSSPHTPPAVEPAGWQMLKRPTVFYPEGWRPTDINNFRALYAAPPAPAVEPGSDIDPADIITGALQTSRGHAYELMERAVRERYPAVEPDGHVHLFRKIGGGRHYEVANLGGPRQNPDPEDGFEWYGSRPFYTALPPVEPVALTDAQILANADRLFPDWREDIQERFVLLNARAALALAAAQEGMNSH